MRSNHFSPAAPEGSSAADKGLRTSHHDQARRPHRTQIGPKWTDARRNDPGSQRRSCRGLRRLGGRRRMVEPQCVSRRGAKALRVGLGSWFLCAASFVSRCQRDNVGASPPDRVRPLLGGLLGRRDRAQCSSCRRGDPRACGLRHGRSTSTAISAWRSGWSGGCSRCWSRWTCTASTTRSSSSRLIPITAQYFRSGIGSSGPIRASARAQHDKIVFGVRELPRRDCLKPSAMFLTPWRIARAARATGRQAA